MFAGVFFLNGILEFRGWIGSHSLAGGSNENNVLSLGDCTD